VFDNDAELRAFSKIYTVIAEEKPVIVQSHESVAHLVFGNQGIFLATKDLFESSMPNIYEF